MILAIETSTTFASVAVLADGAIKGTSESEARTHSERLIELVDMALREAGTTLAALDGIAVGVGPGSFTGLRIGIATAKGLCYAADKPMWAVSSLAALALEAASSRPEDAALVPVLDARRKEVFAGFFDRSGATLASLAPEIVIAPTALAAAVREAIGERGAILVGDGAHLYKDVIAGGLHIAPQPTRPTAEFVARLAMRAPPEANLAHVAPVYIRKSEAEIRYPDGNPGGSYAPIKDS